MALIAVTMPSGASFLEKGVTLSVGFFKVI
jgi:hypothetical protein